MPKEFGDHESGYRGAYRDIIAYELITTAQKLMTNPDNSGPSATRTATILRIYQRAASFARFGPEEISIDQGFDQFECPPVPSKYLVEAGIITSRVQIDQIEHREKARKKRKQRPSENKLKIKALTPEEKGEIQLEDIKTILDMGKPVLRFTESFTIADPKQEYFEKDRLRVYYMGEVLGSGKFEIVLAEEVEIDHDHFPVRGGTPNRFDHNTNPDLYPPPRVKLIKEIRPANQKQLATIFALLEFPQIEALKAANAKALEAYRESQPAWTSTNT